MDTKKKVLISSGDNKSHLIAIASELSQSNFYNIYFLCSLYPYFFIRLLLRIISPYFRSISRFIDRKESIDEKKVYSLFIAEIISKISLIIEKRDEQGLGDEIQNIGMRYYGYSSTKILKKVKPVLKVSAPKGYGLENRYEILHGISNKSL